MKVVEHTKNFGPKFFIEDNTVDAISLYLPFSQ